MKQKIMNILALPLLFFLMANCGGDDPNQTGEEEALNSKEYNIYTKPEKEESPVEIDPMKDKGVGPVSEVLIAEEIDTDLSEKGNHIFEAKCTACHKTNKKFIGPNPTGVLDRRSPEWVMNMILNPEEMIVENAAAKQLMIEYNGAPMANQNLTQDEARAILEYFRTL
jgi:mono/diheme cytochrome c family protein